MPASPRSGAELLAEIARRTVVALGSGWSVSVQDEVVTVRAASGEGLPKTFPFADIFGAWRRMQPALRETWLANMVQQIVSLVRTGEGEVVQRALDFGWARHRLFPRFVSAEHEPRLNVPPVQRPWLRGLGIGYLIDDREAGLVIPLLEDMRAAWGVAEESLLGVALENLERRRLKPRPVGGGVAYLLHDEDNVFLSAPQVLLTDQMQHLADLCRSDALAVALPCAAAALVCAARFAQTPGVRAPITRLYRSTPQRLLAEPLSWERGVWGEARQH